MSKVAYILGLIMISVLVHRLMAGDGNFQQKQELVTKLDEINLEVERLKSRNDFLYAQLQYLKKEPRAIEERARFELGLIIPGESYYQLLEPVN